MRVGRRFLVWFWSSGGGGSQFAVRLAYRLGKRYGAENVTLSLRADDPTADWARAKGVRVLTADIVSDRTRPLRTLTDLSKGAAVLKEHIRESGADAVILAMNFAAAAPLSTTLQVPLVYCAHDPLPHTGDYAVRMQRMTQGFLLRRADTILALSEYAAGQLRGMGVSEDKLVTMPLASVFDPHESVVRTAQKQVQLLFVGRMIAYKGLDTLAAVLRRIAHRDDWHLRIAGKGPALTQQALDKLTMPQVEIVSQRWMSHEQIDNLFQGSDVLLAPYSEATQSGVVADAMAWGVPVVATPVGALREQLGDGAAGWLARDASPEAFAELLETVLQDRIAIADKAAAAARYSQKLWSEDRWSWLGEAAADPQPAPELAVPPARALSAG